MVSMFDRFVHGILRVPYTLHVYRYSEAKKAKKTIVFLHGIGQSGKTWDDVVEHVPDDVNIAIIDLLGFGDSPKPEWASYDAKTQARAVARTLLTLRVTNRVVIVGHSMGALVAVEFARQFPGAVKALVLCSPPLYKMSRDGRRILERDNRMRELYAKVAERPENIIMLSKIAKRYRLMNPSFDATAINLKSYVAALHASIIRQTAMNDIITVKKPIRILYGMLDPFVIGANIRSVAQKSENITIHRFTGGHEVTRGYVSRIANTIHKVLQ